MRMKMISVWCLLLFLAIPLSASACTAWEVAGNSVEGSAGTIIAKNRDYAYGETNQLKLVTHTNGYKYLAIFANAENNKGGVNEKGLSVFSLSAPSEVEEEAIVANKAWSKFTNTWILEHYATVDETISALQHVHWNTHPEFLAIADKNKVAYIEIGPDGSYEFKSTDNGVLDHTNHYLENDMTKFNPQKLGYELKRLEKADEQLGSQDKFSIENIKNFTQDPIVWYKHPKIMTYASMVVNNKPDGTTLIWVKIANPNEEEFISQFTLEDALERKVDFK